MRSKIIHAMLCKSSFKIISKWYTQRANLQAGWCSSLRPYLIKTYTYGFQKNRCSFFLFFLNHLLKYVQVPHTRQSCFVCRAFHHCAHMFLSITGVCVDHKLGELHKHQRQRHTDIRRHTDFRKYMR